MKPNAPTLVLGAMPSEIASIKTALAERRDGEFEGIPYWTGRLGARDVVLSVSGVGLTSAAMCSALLIHEFGPAEVIFTGSGARLNPELRVGDVVIASKTAHHNSGNWTDSGVVYRKVRSIQKGRMMPYEFRADPRLLRTAKRAAKSFPPKTISLNGKSHDTRVKVGQVCSGDFFGVTEAKIKDIRSKLGSDLIEMEGSAVAQVCYQMAVPHLVIRSGSNEAQPDPGVAYRSMGQIAAHQAARFTMHFLAQLDREGTG